MKIGDKIRDIEDGDCYYEGIIVSLNPIKYKLTGIVWNGEEEKIENNVITCSKWWYLELANE